MYKVKNLIYLKLLLGALFLKYNLLLAAPVLFENAYHYQQKKQFTKAIQSYRNFLNKSPQHFQALINVSYLEYTSGNQDQAIADLEHALKIRPFSIEANYNLGLVLKLSGQLHLSTTYFEAITKIRKNHSDSYLQLMDLFDKLKLPDQAIKYALILEKQNPAEWKYLIIISRLLRKYKNYSESERVMWKVLQYASGNLELNYEYGGLLDEMGNRIESAIAQYRNVLYLDPNHHDAHYKLALNLEKLKKWKEAETQYHLLVKKDPQYAKAWVQLAHLARLKNNNKECLDYLERAITANPMEISAYENKAMIYVDDEKYDLAAHQFHLISNFKPNYEKAYLFKGWLYQKLEKYQLAIYEYKKALSYYPDSLNSNLAIADLYYQLKNHPLAVTHYEKVMEFDPHKREVAYRLADSYLILNRLDRAKYYIDRVAKGIAEDERKKSLEIEIKRLPSSDVTME